MLFAVVAAAVLKDEDLCDEIISLKLGNLCVAYVGDRTDVFAMFGCTKGLDGIGLFSTV